VTGLTWATHPNHALRLALAEYLGRGWTIELLGADSAVVTRRKQWSRPGRVLMNPLYVAFMGRKDRHDRYRLTVSPAGEVVVTTV
jgi:hypothetical protein